MEKQWGFFPDYANRNVNSWFLVSKEITDFTQYENILFSILILQQYKIQKQISRQPNSVVGWNDLIYVSTTLALDIRYVKILQRNQ